MPLGGAGAILKVKSGDLNPTPEIGDQAGLDGAKLYALGGLAGGVVHMGPGLDALVIGSTGWGGVFPAVGVVLVRYAADGIHLSRLHTSDGVDPTKSVHWDHSGITTGIERTITLPDWSGILPLPLDFGVAGRFLKSNGAGAAPTWDVIALTNALLDGANHSDTVAQTVARGALIVGNSTPKWDRLAIGAAGTVLGSNGTDPAWISNPAVEHNGLAHLKPFSVANCSIANATNRLDTATANGFATVRVGDHVRWISSTGSTLWGAKVSGLVDSDSVDLDKTNGSGATINSTVIIVPGDHWDDTISDPVSGTGAGLLMTLGRGTYDASATPGGTMQELRGSYNHEGYESGHACDFRLIGSTSTATPFGVCFKKPGTANRAYIHTNDLALGTVVLRLGNPASGDFFAYTNLQQDIISKRFLTAIKIQMDGTNTYAVFMNAANQDRLSYDLTAMTALRSVSWPDYAGRAHVEGAPVTFANGDTTPSVSGSRVFVTGNAGATSITTFDDAVNGQEITVIAGDNNTTIVAGANMKTPGGANVVLTTDDVIRLVKSGATWFVQTVSVNA